MLVPIELASSLITMHSFCYQISVYPRIVVPENPNSYRARKRESFRVQRERLKARKEARLSYPQLILAAATDTTTDEPNC